MNSDEIGFAFVFYCFFLFVLCFSAKYYEILGADVVPGIPGQIFDARFGWM
jgi:hypothetical protein